MKQIKKVVALLAVCCLILSCFAFQTTAANSGKTVAKLYVCARTSGRPIPHIFIYVENLSNESIQVGAYTVKKNQGVSVGTWGFRTKNGIGIYYNVEAYLTKKYGPSDVICLSKELNASELKTVSNKIRGFNFWDPIFFNCVFFAFQVWDSVSPIILIPFIFPFVGRLQIFLHGGKHNLNMYLPERSQVHRQKGSGNNATLSSVANSMVNSNY